VVVWWQTVKSGRFNDIAVPPATQHWPFHSACGAQIKLEAAIYEQNTMRGFMDSLSRSPSVEQAFHTMSLKPNPVADTHQKRQGGSPDQGMVATSEVY
jgi:hypothetical protein